MKALDDSSSKIGTYYYLETTYIWLNESQNLYGARHISIRDAILVINRGDTLAVIQSVGGEERYRHIGISSACIITVITDHSETRSITAWHASTTEVKEWLVGQ